MFAGMARGRRGATGRDYLTGAANQLSGQVDARAGEDFLNLIRYGGLESPIEGLPGGVVPAELIARRPLKLWEVHAMATIGAAHDQAMSDRNSRAAQEILAAGLLLMARMPNFVRYMHAADEDG